MGVPPRTRSHHIAGFAVFPERPIAVAITAAEQNSLPNFIILSGAAFFLSAIEHSICKIVFYIQLKYTADSIKVALGIGNCVPQSYCLVVTQANCWSEFHMPKRSMAKASFIESARSNNVRVTCDNRDPRCDECEDHSVRPWRRGRNY